MHKQLHTRNGGNDGLDGVDVYLRANCCPCHVMFSRLCRGSSLVAHSADWTARKTARSTSGHGLQGRQEPLTALSVLKLPVKPSLVLQHSVSLLKSGLGGNTLSDGIRNVCCSISHWRENVGERVCSSPKGGASCFEIPSNFVFALRCCHVCCLFA